MAQAMTAQENRGITGIRGAAATFVMIYHFEHGLKLHGIAAVFLNHGYLSVDLFFVLSGFVMSLVYGSSLRDNTFSFPEFLWHRMARVFPLYLLATCGVLLIDTVKAHHAVYGSEIVVSNVLMLQSLGNWPSIDPPAWSVSAELIAYVLFPLLAGVCLTRRLKWSLAIGLVALFIILVLTVAAGRHWIGSPIAKGQLDLFYSPFTIVRCLCGFTIGLLVWRIHALPAVARWSSNNTVQTAVLVACLATIMVTGEDFLAYLAIVALILCLSANHGILASLFGAEPMHFLGRISFPIYLLHYKALGLIAAIHLRLQGSGLPYMVRHPLGIASGAVIVLCLSWVVHEAIERPCRRLMRRIAPRTLYSR